MRIKEEFKRLGYFWLPSAPDKELPGILSISDGGTIDLEVVHRVGGRNAAFDGDIKRIVGEIERDGLVTLDDCYYKPRIIRAIGGPSKSFIHVGRAFIGVKYDESEPPLFNTLTFSVEGIDEWVGISGINVDHQREEHTATISYQPPETISFNLDNGMQLLITFKRALPGFPIIKEAKISQEAYFTLISRKMRELDEFISVAHKITTFLCFAIDETVSLNSMEATSDDLHRNIGEGRTRPIQINIYYPSWPYSKEEPRVYQNYLLFGFEQIQNDAKKRINKWIEIHKKIEPALDLYFLAKMGAHPSSKAKFLALAQGLEASHRRISGERQADEPQFEALVKNLINQCPPEHREQLEEKLSRNSEMNLRKRLGSIIEPFKEIIGNRRKRDSLIHKIVVMRNYLTHYDPSWESEIPKDEDLPLLCLKMEFLFQLYLLQLIDFSQEEIKAIIPKLQWKLQ